MLNCSSSALLSRLAGLTLVMQLPLDVGDIGLSGFQFPAEALSKPFVTREQ